MCSEAGLKLLQLFSSEVNGRTCKLLLHCLLVLKYVLEEELDSSAQEDTEKKERKQRHLF